MNLWTEITSMNPGKPGGLTAEHLAALRPGNMIIVKSTPSNVLRILDAVENEFDSAPDHIIPGVNGSMLIGNPHRANWWRHAADVFDEAAGLAGHRECFLDIETITKEERWANDRGPWTRRRSWRRRFAERLESFARDRVVYFHGLQLLPPNYPLHRIEAHAHLLKACYATDAPRWRSHPNTAYKVHPNQDLVDDMTEDHEEIVDGEAGLWRTFMLRASDAPDGAGRQAYTVADRDDWPFDDGRFGYTGYKDFPKVVEALTL